MKDLKNLNLPFKKLGDLVYHEGPILSLYIDDHSNMFLYRWVDCDDKMNFWILTSISSYELSQFYHKKLSLRQYYESCNAWVIVKIDNLLKIREIISLDIIPKDYLPKENSFYNEPLYTEFSNSWKTMYVNGLGVVNYEKADLYEYLGFKDKTTNDNKSASLIANLVKPKINIPKISVIQEASMLFRAFNHEIRRKIVELVFNTPGVTIGEICNHFEIEQDILSQHIAILKACKVITTKRQLNLVKYYINIKKINNVNLAIDALEDKKEIIYQ
jgi:DNA-binding transcriptional ArsR family regulator